LPITALLILSAGEDPALVTWGFSFGQPAEDVQQHFEGLRKDPDTQLPQLPSDALCLRLADCPEGSDRFDVQNKQSQAVAAAVEEVLAQLLSRGYKPEDVQVGLGRLWGLGYLNMQCHLPCNIRLKTYRRA
jgi:hypothetical protein